MLNDFDYDVISPNLHGIDVSPIEICEYPYVLHTSHTECYRSRYIIILYRTVMTDVVTKLWEFVFL